MEHKIIECSYNTTVQTKIGLSRAAVVPADRLYYCLLFKYT